MFFFTSIKFIMEPLWRGILRYRLTQKLLSPPSYHFSKIYSHTDNADLLACGELENVAAGN